MSNIRTMPADLLFPVLKITHTGCALLSITGFFLRGYWMWKEQPQLHRRSTKILPHLIDTLLLGSAIGMLIVWGINPLALPWLTAKIVALCAYIGLGMVALRFGRTRKERVTAWVLALLCALYIISVALTKSVWGFLLWCRFALV